MTRSSTAWILSAALGAGALGQAEPQGPFSLPPTFPPAFPSSNEVIRIAPTIVVPQALATVLAVSPGQPTPADALQGLAGEDVAVPPERLLPEGAFLSARSGVLLRAPSGEWIFVSTADAQGVRNPPLVLVPCATLDELERSLDPAGGQGVTLSGQVLVYRDRNYLLTTLATLGTRPSEAPQDTVDSPTSVSGEAQESDADGPGGRADTPPSPAPGGDEDPRVAALLDQLRVESERTSLLAPPMERDDPDEARGRALLHDGRLVIRERGRIVRLAGGRAAFARDQDGDHRDPPRVLLPSATLTRIEVAIARTGETTPVLISGRLYAHNGTVYLLPVSFQTVPASDVRGMQ